MRFPLVVFDLDGTLVDSRRDLADAANALLEECGAAPHTEEAIGRMVGDGAATLVARAFAAAACPQPEDALRRFLDIYNGRLLAFTSALAAATLAALSLRQSEPLAFWPPVLLFTLIALTCWSWLRHRRK